ncbi:MAG: hypothetical protein E7596_02115 [Ruminococcaceae bacterium]|nr:hypothetical protein [Oscillospiraceae bacterium]
MKKYILTSTTYYTDNEIIFYGIALIKTNDKSYELIKAFNDLTDNKAKAQALVNHCNNTNLNSIHFENIIQDLIAE